MNTFDLAGYHFLNQWAGHFPVLDLIMAFFAQYALELYAILFVIAWITLPKPNIKQRHALVIMGFSGILALILNFVIAHVWFRPRPFVTLPKGTFTQVIPHSIDASFPSDHTAGSFGFAAGSWSKAQGLVSRSFTVLAILVSIARVYVGVHWPTDVIAGVVIGLISARVMWRFEHFLKPLTNFGLHLFRFGEKEQNASKYGYKT